MIPAIESIALRAMTSKPWVLSVGRHSNPARGVSPLALEWEASDMNAPSVAAWGVSPRSVAILVSRSATSLS
jgi:hypothetical protein